jgi:hypothetical protein
MGATLHRWLMFIGGTAGGLGGLWTLTDVEPLGIPTEAGAVCSLVAFIAILLANQIRIAWPAGQP